MWYLVRKYISETSLEFLSGKCVNMKRYEINGQRDEKEEFQPRFMSSIELRGVFSIHRSYSRCPHGIQSKNLSVQHIGMVP